MSCLSAPHFHSEAAAYRFVEARLWPEGPVCPKCGERERVGRLKGKSTRIGVRKCYACRKPFTVKVGTVFESSHVPLNKWLQAIFLVASSKKGISANQLHRTLDVTLKTAWFMGHRIREAMRSGNLAPMGGDGGVVEADETYYGQVDKANRRTHNRDGQPYKGNGRGGGGANKRAIVALVERQGSVRSFHVRQANKVNVTAIVNENVDREARLFTDESQLYNDAHHLVSDHQRVKHASGEYVRGEVHSNTVESYFSIFKRGMRGTYQHCAEKHLHRYLAEFDFRHNHRVALGVDDTDRAASILAGVAGRRLTYQTAGAR